MRPKYTHDYYSVRGRRGRDYYVFTTRASLEDAKTLAQLWHESGMRVKICLKFLDDRPEKLISTLPTGGKK